MDTEKQKILEDVNRAIIQFRGIYSIWASEHGITYNEMLVLYTIRESGYCTQKQICEQYLLPKQTIHNVITQLRKAGILENDETRRDSREKAFILTARGKEYAAPFMNSLNAVEERALTLTGEDKLRSLTQLLLEYGQMLQQALKESR